MHVSIPRSTPHGRARSRLVRAALASAVLAVALPLTAQAAEASYSVKVKKRTLTVKGNGAGDKLALRVRSAAPGKLEVDVRDDGTADFKVPRGEFDRIRVKAGGGADQVRIDEASVVFTDATPTRLDGQAGNDTLLGGVGAEKLFGQGGVDTIDGNRGNDKADLGAGDDRFIWDPGDGSDIVEGRRGQDVLVFNGNGANERFDVTPNGQRARVRRDVGNITMDLKGIEQADVAALGGNDTLTVDDMAATDLRAVNGDLAGTLGTAGDSGTDQAILNGTAGADPIVASGSAGSATVSGLPTTLSLAHTEAARDSLVINALAGDDSVSAQTLAADSVRFTADGGAGDDTLLASRGADVLLGGDGDDVFDGNQGDDLALMGAGDDRFIWDPGDGSDTLEGQDGTDTMTFNGNGANENFDVSANGQRVRFFRNVANVTMDLDDVERIDTAALGGADTMVVNDLSGTDVTALNTDLAAVGGNAGDNASDRLIAIGTNGDDVATASGSAGSVTVLGLAARIDIAHAQAANDVLEIHALAGDDVVEASALAADAIQLTAEGGDGDDVLIGGAGGDTLLGQAGDDVLLGGPGNDKLDGGPGDNIVIQD